MRQVLFVLSGTVTRGAGLGRKLGFPTANLDRREYARGKLYITFGVYAGTAAVSDTQKKYRAGIVIGPIDKSGLPKIEAHLLDFSGRLYGKKVSLFLIRYLRPYKTFKTADALKKQIMEDLERVRRRIWRGLLR